MKYIEENVLWEYYCQKPENNLLKHLRTQYPKEDVDDIKYLYCIGTTKDGGTVFWNINNNLQIQKNKICYYNIYSKRTNKFKVPYKNHDGHYSCLFGEHLLLNEYKGADTVVLVESEKTAIVGALNLPSYIWLSYGGLILLTDKKLTPLIGHRVLIIPDISNRAVNHMEEKLPKLRQLGIDANIWDMTYGLTDEQLKKEGIYNNDLEDFFQKIKNSFNT